MSRYRPAWIPDGGEILFEGCPRLPVPIAPIAKGQPDANRSQAAAGYPSQAIKQHKLLIQNPLETQDPASRPASCYASLGSSPRTRKPAGHVAWLTPNPPQMPATPGFARIYPHQRGGLTEMALTAAPSNAAYATLNSAPAAAVSPPPIAATPSLQGQRTRSTTAGKPGPKSGPNSEANPLPRGLPPPEPRPGGSGCWGARQPLPPGRGSGGCRPAGLPAPQAHHRRSGVESRFRSNRRRDGRRAES